MNFVQMLRHEDPMTGLSVMPGINLDQVRKFELLANMDDKDENRVFNPGAVQVKVTWTNGQEEIFKDGDGIQLAAIIAGVVTKSHQVLMAPILKHKEEKRNGLGLH